MIETAATRYHKNFSFYSNDQFIGQSIRLYGEYTEPEVMLMSNFIGPDTVVLDIGANIGYHTTAFATLAKQVWAFEPNTRNRNLLGLNTAHAKNVRVLDYACSNQDGISLIGDFDPNVVANYGKCEVSAVGTFRDLQICNIRRIDGLNLPAPGLIKIDVEGHELQVMVGAEQTIRRSHPVIFYEAQHVPGQDQIYRFLVNGLGYRLYWFPVHNYNPNNYYGNPDNVFLNGGVVNILAVPPNIPELNLDSVLSDTETSTDYVTRRLSRARA